MTRSTDCGCSRDRLVSSMKHPQKKSFNELAISESEELEIPLCVKEPPSVFCLLRTLIVFQK